MNKNFFSEKGEKTPWSVGNRKEKFGKLYNDGKIKLENNMKII